MQRQRTWTPKDLSIARVVGELTQSVRRQEAARARAQDALASATTAGLPGELAAWVRAASRSRGTLTLVARDASSRYRVQQWLRGGGEAAMRKASPGVTRVKVVLDEHATPPAGGGKGGGS